MLVAKQKVDLTVILFVKDVLAKVLPVIILCYALPLILIRFVEPSVWRIILTTMFSAMVICIVVTAIGLSNGERKLVTSKIMALINRIKR